MKNSHNKQGDGRPQPEVTSRLIQKVLNNISEQFKDVYIEVQPISEDFVMQKLKKPNRVRSNANIKDRMYRNDYLRDKARAKRRAFCFVKHVLAVYLS
jgi:hypothetical protein